MKLKFNKHVVLRSIISLFTILVLFILINLIIGCFKYGGIYSYAQLLDSKDWSSSISQMTIKNPLAIFNADRIILDEDLDKNIDNNIDIQNTQETQDEVTENTGDDTDIQNNEIDPYDPEFEDEFNSFFGGEKDTQDQTIIESGENTQDTTIGFIDDSHPVAEELIKKFNE